MTVEILKAPSAGGIYPGDLRERAGASDDRASRVVAGLDLRFVRKVGSLLGRDEIVSQGPPGETGNKPLRCDEVPSDFL